MIYANKLKFIESNCLGHTSYYSTRFLYIAFVFSVVVINVGSSLWYANLHFA